jgi:hypothetical protein
MKQAYTIFHLNLAYSSIAEEQRLTVIEKCYMPLLELIEQRNFKIGVELTGWTLMQINTLAPEWIKRFRAVLAAGRTELIGSGYCQIIGPLIPFEVNQWNQRLGLQVYEELLGVRPRLALVNEMAYSSGVLEFYQEAGYEGIIMDRDNVTLAHDLAGHAEELPSYASDQSGQIRMPVLWSDSILFQKLQRYTHGDIRLADYLGYFEKRLVNNRVPLALYCNDAEVFDYRPGRFDSESKLHPEGEWRRLAGLLDRVAQGYPVELALPSVALAHYLAQSSGESLCLTSAAQPIPVKKQAKYNVSRWAITGRDNLWINTMCHRLYQQLKGRQDVMQWRVLCELWASDIRTHITPERWSEARERARQMLASLGSDNRFDGGIGEQFSSSAVMPGVCDGVVMERYPEGIMLELTTKEMRLRLNLRRGLAIDELSFRSHGWKPVIGTLPHGYFDSIDLGADFYSAITVIEKVTQHKRITDLEKIEPIISHDEYYLYLRAVLSTKEGEIVKHLRLSRNGEELVCGIEFPGWKRPYGTVRTGYVTFLPETFAGVLKVETRNGGRSQESFELDRDALHTQPASTLVSATTGLGGGSGSITVTDGATGVEISWQPSSCAAFPMLYHRECSPASLTRVIFSLAELDESFRDGAELPGFCYTLRPAG